MAINEWNIWKRLGWVKEHEYKRVHPIEDIKEVIDFLENLNSDVKELLPDLNKLLELEKERKVAEEGIVQMNLESQGEVLKKLMLRYSLFIDDTDINWIRLKRVSKQFIYNCNHSGMKYYVKENKNKFKFW